MLLAIRGRMVEVEQLFEHLGATLALRDVVPYPPFDAEVKYGRGVPSSLDDMLTKYAEEKQYGLANNALKQCTRAHPNPSYSGFQQRDPDWHSASACAQRLFEFTRTDAHIKFERNSIENRGVPARMAGRYGTATTLIEVAYYAREDQPGFSGLAENYALQLLEDAPPIKTDFIALTLLQLLSETELEFQGRF